MRKTFIYIVIISIFLMSCIAQKKDRGFYHGTFNAVNQSYKGLPTYYYTLEINQDSTFTYSIKVGLGGSYCSGKWKINKNILLIECNEITDPMEGLTRGGMSGEQEFEILNKNKLKYKDIVLKRKK